MRILHTADWHLGQTLHDFGRDPEHDEFFSWLLRTIGEQEIDALLVAGDVFDAANPPARAQQLFFRFVAEARRRHPGLEIVIVGGNHDSAARLDAPSPLLDAFQVRVVGGLPRRGDDIDFSKVIVPLPRKTQVEAVVLAVPYLKGADLPPLKGDDPLVDGVRIVYRRIIERAHEKYPGVPIVAMGHLYMRSGAVSELSERKILGGNLHAVPSDVFDGVSYAALGHLHLPQTAGGPHLRYSGSPIPLSLAERSYPHQVVWVELPGDERGPVRIEPIRVPRFVDMLRIPERGYAELDEIVNQLQSLELEANLQRDREPFVEVAVRLEKPEPRLRRLVEDALSDKPVRLARITIDYAAAQQAAERQVAHLSELRVEEVFDRLWSGKYEKAVPREVKTALAELVERAQHEEREEP